MRLGQVSPEGAFVRSLLLPTASDQLPGACSLHGPALAEALMTHRVSCTVHPLVPRLPWLPTEALAAVKQRRRGMALGLLAMQADLAWLTRVLEQVGAPWVVVKGPATAMTLYGGLELREWGDLDVVVDPAGFPEALRALEDAGALLVDRNWALIRERVQAELSLTMPHGTALDLHWHLVNSRLRRESFRIDMADVLARRREIDVRGMAVPVVAPVDQLLHLCLHGCLSGGHRLQWLKDVQLAASQTQDWGQVTARAAAFGLGLPTALMLERAALHLDAPVPDHVLSALGSRGVWRTAGRVAGRLAPPADSHLEGRSGKIVFFSTRRTDVTSIVELGKRVASRRGHLHEVEAPPSGDTNPLHCPGGTPADRDAYLQAVAAQGSPDRGTVTHGC